MTLGDTYRTLGDLLEEFDDRDIDVTAVDPKPIEGSPLDSPLEVQVTLFIPAGNERLAADGADRCEADGEADEDRTETAEAGSVRSARALDSASDEAAGERRTVLEPRSSAAAASNGASRTDGGSTARIDSAGPNPLDGGVALVRTPDEDLRSAEDADDADESSIGDGSEPASDEAGTNAERADVETESDSADDATSSTADAATSTDGADRVACRGDNCDATFENEHGMKIHYAKVHAADGAAEKPAYTDPDALREVYERHETFAEMTRALDVDVTPATVRRHMIEQGIHEPSERQFDVRAAVENAIDGTDRTADSDAIEDADRPPETDDRLPGDESEADSSEAETSASDEPEARSNVDTDESTIADRNRDGEGAGRRDETSEGETIDGQTIDGDSDSADGDSNPTDPKTDESDADRPDTDGGATNAPEADDRADGVEYSVPDDVDLPSGITLADVADAIETANTLYEVGRELRMSRERAQRLLRDLELLDLVVGRLATTDERERMRAIVDDRLRAANAAGEAA